MSTERIKRKGNFFLACKYSSPPSDDWPEPLDSEPLKVWAELVSCLGLGFAGSLGGLVFAWPDSIKAASHPTAHRKVLLCAFIACRVECLCTRAPDRRGQQLLHPIWPCRARPGKHLPAILACTAQSSRAARCMRTMHAHCARAPGELHTLSDLQLLARLPLPLPRRRSLHWSELRHWKN